MLVNYKVFFAGLYNCLKIKQLESSEKLVRPIQMLSKFRYASLYIWKKCVAKFSAVESWVLNALNI